MNDKPQFKIHGGKRREKKKKLADLKSFKKDFWHCHQMDKDMASIYGGKDTYPMNDEKAKKMYDKTKKNKRTWRRIKDTLWKINLQLIFLS